MLLTDPRINPNVTNDLGFTPFDLACSSLAPSSVKMVKELLKHPMLMLNHGSEGPLDAALAVENRTALVWILASGKPLSFARRGQQKRLVTETRPGEILVNEFWENPAGIRTELRKELGIHGKFESLSYSLRMKVKSSFTTLQRFEVHGRSPPSSLHWVFA